MDYEKKYKEALTKAESYYRNGQGSTRSLIYNIFPELKESEDERIKRDVIETLRYGLACEESVLMPGATTTLKEALAWLEKQGEKGTNGNEREIPNSQQKSKIKYVYTKFREGDVIVEIKPNGDCDPVRVKYVGSSYYSCESDDGKVYLSLPIINQDEYKLIEQNPSWSEEDEKFFNTALWHISHSVSNGKNTDEHCATTDWLKSLKDRVLPRQQEWSEEDEKMIGNIRRIIEQDAFSNYAVDIDGDFCEKAYIDADNWLKKLKERYTWKPSEE